MDNACPPSYLTKYPECSFRCPAMLVVGDNAPAEEGVVSPSSYKIRPLRRFLLSHY